MEHILTIRLQFEDLGPDAEKEIEGAAKKVEDTLTDGYERAAVAGGEAMIRGMSTLKEAWHSFDWGSPIDSFKKLFGGAIDWIKNKFGILGKLALGAIALLAAGFKMMLGPQATMVDTFSQLKSDMSDVEGYGSSFQKNVGRALVEVAEISKTTGMAVGEVAEHFAELAKARVPLKDVKQLTQASILGAKALGANVDQMREFVAGLSVMGKLSAEEISGRNGMIQAFSKVQDAVGLTEKEMSTLLESTTRLVRQMGALGAATKDIQSVATASAELTGIFGELGLGADRASDIMGKLFDPSAIGENAYLVRSMGFSMQEYMEMLNGGTADQEKLTRGLINAAGEIKNMQDAGANAMAMNQRAQMLGFANSAEALRLAKEGHQELNAIRSAGSETNWEDRAAEGMSKLNEVVGRLKNRFMATFGKVAAPIMEKMMTLVIAFEKSMIENEGSIIKFFDVIIDGAVSFIQNLDMGKILAGLTKLGQAFKWVASHMKLILTLAGALVVAFAGFKIFTLVKSLGGLSKGLSGVGKAAGGAGGAAKGISGFMKIILKAAAGVAVLVLLAGGIWLLAQALKTFSNDVDWGGMAKAGVALVVVTAAMIGLGLFFATPVGMAAIAGALAFSIALIALSVGLLLLAVAIKKFGDAAESIERLGSIASPELAENLMTVGKAVNAFSKEFKALQLLKAPALILLGEAIKRFAVGLYILGEVKNLKSATDSMSDVAAAVKILSQGRFRSNAKKIGDTISSLAESLSVMSEIKPEDFDRLGPAMMSVEDGFRSLMNAFTGGTGDDRFLARLGDKVLEGTTKFQPIAAAFKDLAIGLYILGEAGEDSLSTLKELPEGLVGLTDVLKEWGSDRSISKGIRNMTGLLNSLESAGISTNMAVNATGTAKLTPEMDGSTNIESVITIAFEDSTNRLIDKLDNIFDDEWRARDESMAASLQGMLRRRG